MRMSSFLGEGWVTALGTNRTRRIAAFSGVSRVGARSSCEVGRLVASAAGRSRQCRRVRLSLVGLGKSAVEREQPSRSMECSAVCRRIGAAGSAAAWRAGACARKVQLLGGPRVRKGARDWVQDGGCGSPGAIVRGACAELEACGGVLAARWCDRRAVGATVRLDWTCRSDPTFIGIGAGAARAYGGPWALRGIVAWGGAAGGGMCWARGGRVAAAGPGVGGAR